MKSQGKTVEEYLKNCPSKERKALQNLRKAILSASTKLEEYIGYGMPMYKYYGHVTAFGLFKNHCSMFIMSARYFKLFAKELKGFDLKGTTIHFVPDHPIPASTVKKIVKLRIKENEERQKAREALKAKKKKK